LNQHNGDDAPQDGNKASKIRLLLTHNLLILSRHQ